MEKILNEPGSPFVENSSSAMVGAQGDCKRSKVLGKEFAMASALSWTMKSDFSRDQSTLKLHLCFVLKVYWLLMCD